MKDIKLRIRSVQSTMQITKAMELVASSKLRRAKERAENSRPYFELLYDSLCDSAAASGRDVAAIAHELDAYNQAARAACQARGIAFVDITPASRDHGAEPGMLAEDGLHPSARMYAEWTRLALPVARRLLQPPGTTP